MNNEYSEEKKDLMEFWRPIIFKRDHHQCTYCKSKKAIQMAHITPCIDFVNKFGLDGVALSFQLDNLLTLCEECHFTYHYCRWCTIDKRQD